MDAEGGEGGSDVKANELKEHVDAIKEETFNESAGDSLDERHKPFLMVTVRESTEVIGEIS